MKVCRRGYEYLQVCNGDGTVRPCSWCDYKMVGKLTEESMYDIMHGKKMNEWMESLLDGSYRYCSVDQCPYLSNGILEEHSVEYRGELDHPLELSISYDNSCNYMCPSCRREGYINECVPGDSKARDFEKIQNEIKVFLNDVECIGSNGTGELFSSSSIMDMLAEWEPTCEKPRVDLETNGSLFNAKNWAKIEKLGQYELNVYITVMSFDNMTYQYLSGVKYDISRIEENLRFVKSLREKNIINYVELATVVQERNFRTLPDFTRRCIEEFGADTVRLRPYYPYGVYAPEIEWFFDVRNVLHPYHKEYIEVMKDPIFKNPKVYHWAGEEIKIPMPASGAGNSRHTKQYNITGKLFRDESFAKEFSEYLLEKGESEVYIYAAGILGKILVHFLQDTGIEIKGFIDEYSQEESYKGIPIYRMANEEVDKSKLVIISLPDNYDGVLEGLNKAGFTHVIALEKLLNDIKSCDCC